MEDVHKGMRVLANLRCGAYPCVMLYFVADYRMAGTGTGRLNSGISPRWERGRDVQRVGWEISHQILQPSIRISTGWDSTAG